MTQHRKHRGYQSQSIVAAYLAEHGFPFAMSTGAGRAGTDVTGTPALSWEVKARRGLNLGADLRQAAGHGGDLGILVVRLDGQGPASIADWPMVMRLGDGVPLLRQAGYGQPLMPTLALDLNTSLYEED